MYFRALVKSLTKQVSLFQKVDKTHHQLKLHDHQLNQLQLFQLNRIYEYRQGKRFYFGHLIKQKMKLLCQAKTKQ